MKKEDKELFKIIIVNIAKNSDFSIGTTRLLMEFKEKNDGPDNK